MIRIATLHNVNSFFPAVIPSPFGLYLRLMDLPKFDRYEATGILGEGAMGTVYLAFDPRLKREVAIKTVKPEILRQDPGLKARFEREAKIVAALVHPAIVQIYDFGGDYLVMELLKGRELRELLREGRQFTVGEISYLLGQLADGLDHAHAQGIIHRDLKPANLFIDDQNRPKITDFGIAKFKDEAMEGLTAAGQVLGTPAYMSPEQVQGLTLDGRSDQFSLGVLVYQLLAGKSPFAADSVTAIINKIMNVPLPPLRSVNASVPAGLEPVLQKVLAKSPDARYPDCRAFAVGFSRAAGITLDPRATVPGGRMVPAYLSAADKTTSDLPAFSPAEKTVIGPPSFRAGPAAAAGSGKKRWMIGIAALLLVLLGLGFLLRKAGDATIDAVAGGIAGSAAEPSQSERNSPVESRAVNADAPPAPAAEPTPAPKPVAKSVTRRTPKSATASKPAPPPAETSAPEETAGKADESGVVKKKVNKGLSWLKRRINRDKDSGAKPEK